MEEKWKNLKLAQDHEVQAKEFKFYPTSKSSILGRLH